MARPDVAAFFEQQRVRRAKAFEEHANKQAHKICGCSLISLCNRLDRAVWFFSERLSSDVFFRPLTKQPFWELIQDASDICLPSIVLNIEGKNWIMHAYDEPKFNQALALASRAESSSIMRGFERLVIRRVRNRIYVFEPLRQFLVRHRQEE